MTEPVLLSLGSINADFQLRVPDAIEEGRTLLASHFSRLGGGKAANRAFLAHRLGRKARLIGQVGTDDLARQALAPLEEAGLDVSLVLRHPTASTAVSVIAVPPQGKKTIILAANANDDWSEDAMAGACRAIDDAPEGSLLTLDCEIPPALARRAAQAAVRRSLRIVLDPSPADRVSDDLLRLAFAMTPNPKEASTLVGFEVESVEDAAKAALKLRDMGVEAPLVKLADGGCVFVSHEKAGHVRGLELEPEDTTGAGDAFAGAFAVALLDGRSLEDAAAFAVVCSSLAVTRWGSQDAYPARDEIEAQLSPVICDIKRLQTV